MKLFFTWKPPRGLDRLRNAIPELEIACSDDVAEILKLIPDAEIVCVGHWNAEMLRAAKRLRWVHSFSGGVNHALFPEFVASPVPLTCLKGTFDIPAAEYALGVMLAFSRKLEYDIRQRPKRTFAEQEPTELHGKTVGIIGLGNMGAEIAKRCRCFGMTVVGVSRRSRAELPKLLAESDFVIVAVPLTEQTCGMIGAAQLAAMKPTAYLIDVSGRPAIYDLDALQTALRAQQIAGASLQIVPAPDSALWDLENLLISHHRVVSREHFDRGIEAFCDNLRRYRAGQPLVGLVDKAAGY
jgi:phosphoglycerate dehydrogenase-like enzyme